MYTIDMPLSKPYQIIIKDDLASYINEEIKKVYKNKNVYRKDSLRSASHSLTTGYKSAKNANDEFLKIHNNGQLEYIINRYEKERW